MGIYKVQDKFFKKAKEEGFRARSVYKLEAIQDRFHLLRPGMKVLDLGAAPGSFLQLIAQVIGPAGVAIGIDLKPIAGLKDKNVHTYVGDVFDDALVQQVADDNRITAFDVITSDLAPNTSGIKSVDAGRSYDLSVQVLELAKRHLKNGGNLLIKTFPGSDQGELLAMARKQFNKVTTFKPEAVRKTSREQYVVCLSLLRLF